MTLSAPLLWIIFPGLATLLLMAISRWQRITLIAGVSFALVLAFSAWKLPLGQVIDVGSRSFIVETALVLLGRRLELLPAQQPLLALIFLGTAFWFGGMRAARAPQMAIPVGLAVICLLIAALAVEPFFYAALLIEMAVLLCVPLLSLPNRPPVQGALRFVTLQTFGMPFILFTGHLLAGIESNPGDTLLSLRVGILMGLGFGFLLAIFPLHSWLPMIGEESHPYMAAFVYIFLPQMVMLFGLGFLERYAWMRTVPVLFNVLRWAAVLMIAIGGIWAAFQSHAGRLMGYATMVEIGFGLLAVGMSNNTTNSLLLHFALLPARIVALGTLALSLAVLRQRSPQNDIPPTLDTLRGQGWHYPLAAFALLLSMFSLAGLPLLAGFAPRFAIVTELSKSSPLLGPLALAAGGGLVVAALRFLATLFAEREGGAVAMSEWAILETLDQRILLLLGILCLLFLGVFGQYLLPWLEALTRAFPLLAP
jgi:NADH:ubiquinone oxidoreductase subunit 2 (subunit N)